MNYKNSFERGLLIASDPEILMIFDDKQRTLLHWALIQGRIELAHMLVRKTCGVEHVDSLGNSPLHLAAANNLVSLVRDLIDKGSRLDRFNVDGYTPLDSAIIKGNHDVIHYLMVMARTNEVFSLVCKSALFCAVKNNNAELVNKLLVSCSDLGAC